MCSNIFHCMDLFKVRIIKFAILGGITYYAKTFEAYLLQLKPVYFDGRLPSTFHEPILRESS